MGSLQSKQVHAPTESAREDHPNPNVTNVSEQALALASSQATLDAFDEAMVEARDKAKNACYERYRQLFQRLHDAHPGLLERCNEECLALLTGAAPIIRASLLKHLATLSWDDCSTRGFTMTVKTTIALPPSAQELVAFLKAFEGPEFRAQLFVSLYRRATKPR